VVSAPQRREAVRFLNGFQVSQRRGCALLQIGWSSYHYVAHPRDDGPIKERLREIARKYPRYGYRRAWALLVRAGELINPKRVHRLWKQQGLQRPQRRRKPRRKRGGAVPLQATYPNHVWTYDFMEDAVAGRKLRLLTIVDEFTRESLEIVAARSLPSPAVIGILRRLFADRGAPAYLRSDNGPEFVALALKEWLRQKGVKTHYLDPGSPWQNAYGESFNDKFRDECLNQEVFHSVAEARIITNRWRQYYNEERPHSSLGYRTPAEFRWAWEAAQAGAPPPHPRSLSLSGPPAGQEKNGQSGLPCPAVRPSESALGSLSSVALPSAQASTVYHETKASGMMEERNPGF
jgi:putative transposase